MKLLKWDETPNRVHKLSQYIFCQKGDLQVNSGGILKEFQNHLVFKDFLEQTTSAKVCSE